MSVSAHEVRKKRGIYRRALSLCLTLDCSHVVSFAAYGYGWRWGAGRKVQHGVVIQWLDLGPLTFTYVGVGRGDCCAKCRTEVLG